MDSTWWARELRRVFGGAPTASRDLAITGQTDVVLTMSMATASKNMQVDASAFETWALALRIAGAASVTLRVVGEHATNGHFERFRYRVERFSRLFGAWFKAEPVWASPIPWEPVADGLARFVLNVESDPRVDQRRAPSDAFSVTAPESDIEMALVHDPGLNALLSKDFGLTTFDRQLPVGVFDGVVSEKSAMFARGRSAIDLWGISGDRLVLFELKNARNKKLGALSELLLYTYLMRDVQRGVVAFEPKLAARVPSCGLIRKTTGVDAILLAPNIHPLIEGKGGAVVGLLNEAFAAAGEPVTFGLVRLGEGPAFERLI